jgi:hypothetical protein
MKNLAIILVLAIVLIAAISTISNDIKRQSEWTENRETITIRVGYGDTIDGFWAEYAPDWMDRNQYRSEIMELNNLNNCNLRAGQTLKLYVMD